MILGLVPIMLVFLYYVLSTQHNFLLNHLFRLQWDQWVLQRCGLFTTDFSLGWQNRRGEGKWNVFLSCWGPISPGVQTTHQESAQSSREGARASLRGNIIKLTELTAVVSGNRQFMLWPNIVQLANTIKQFLQQVKGWLSYHQTQ